MREEFRLLADWLERGGSFADPPAFADRVHLRLSRALSRASMDEGIRSADLVALVAHALRREAACSPGSIPSLRVPNALALAASATGSVVWPTPEEWRATSLGVLEGGEWLKLTPRSWEPAWLPVAGHELTTPLFMEELRRTYDEVPGDPFLRAVGLNRYRCDAQREAIRAILSVPRGSTVIVNLPTGAGKSLCAHVPALLESERGGVSVVVVPTTALALDQERAVKELVPHPTAYIGGQTTSAREQRDAIRARVRDGSQRILFTSPESLLCSLRPAVYSAAQDGLLRLFVVDEAHMVEQWGDEFRSSFQEIAGLRADLARHAPAGSAAFTTVLLTATLTDTALDTLETLFAGDNPAVTVSAAQLRPEPSYWAVEVPDQDAQVAAVLDAIRHLPRPLMLYVTEPNEAEQWAHRLRAQGHGRLGVVTGDTNNEFRSQVIRRWRAADLDIVVATSAFGLGVDHGDVRVVLHATVPESIDRFYQEVGRGGRDGRASASLVIYTQEDLHRAKAMNRKKIIGIKRGHERWSRMFEAREALDGDRVRVAIDVRPNLSDGIDMDNDLNRAWNVRTLTLMSRARILAFDAEPPPRFRIDLAAGGTDNRVAETSAIQEYERAFAEHRRHRVVSLRHHGSVLREVWEQQVEPLRRRTAGADIRRHALMRELLDGSRCAGDILADAYTIPAGYGERLTAEVTVARACGGCAVCRATGRQPYAAPLPTVLPHWPVSFDTGPVLDDLRGSSSGIAIFYHELPSPHRLARILRWLVGQGIRIAVLPDGLLPAVRESLNQASGERWVFAYPLDKFRFIYAPPLPAFVLLPPSFVLPRHLQNAFERPGSEAPPRVLIAAADTADAGTSHRLLRSTVNCRTFSMDEFSARLGL